MGRSARARTQQELLQSVSLRAWTTLLSLSRASSKAWHRSQSWSWTWRSASSTLLATMRSPLARREAIVHVRSGGTLSHGDCHATRFWEAIPSCHAHTDSYTEKTPCVLRAHELYSTEYNAPDGPHPICMRRDVTISFRFR